MTDKYYFKHFSLSITRPPAFSTPDFLLLRHFHSLDNKAFIDITLRPGIATPAIRSTAAERDVIHKTGSTYHIATPPEEDRATATGDLRKKIREDRSSGSGDMLADRQTDTQRNKLIAIFRSRTGAE